jgi:DNA-binding GntR family transcriptional regulator
MRVDSLFHTEVGRIAGNPVYAWILATIHANIERFFDRKLPRTAPLLDENLQDLHEIAEAVAQGDAARARERAIRHVRRFCGIMAEEDPPASD